MTQRGLSIIVCVVGVLFAVAPLLLYGSTRLTCDASTCTVERTRLLPPSGTVVFPARHLSAFAWRSGGRNRPPVAFVETPVGQMIVHTGSDARARATELDRLRADHAPIACFQRADPYLFIFSVFGLLLSLMALHGLGVGHRLEIEIEPAPRMLLVRRRVLGIRLTTQAFELPLDARIDLQHRDGVTPEFVILHGPSAVSTSVEATDEAKDAIRALLAKSGLDDVRLA